MTSENSVISIRSNCSSSVTKFGKMGNTHLCSKILIYLTRSFQNVNRFRNVGDHTQGGQFQNISSIYPSNTHQWSQLHQTTHTHTPLMFGGITSQFVHSRYLVETTWMLILNIKMWSQNSELMHYVLTINDECFLFVFLSSNCQDSLSHLQACAEQLIRYKKVYSVTSKYRYLVLATY